MRISDWSSDVCSSDLLLCVLCGDEATVTNINTHARTKHTAVNNVQPLQQSKQQVFDHNIPTAAKNRRSHLATNSALAMARRHFLPQIGRASCRERVCQYV